MDEEVYTKHVEDLRKEIFSSRQDRKRKRALEKITDPEAAAAKQLQPQQPQSQSQPQPQSEPVPLLHLLDSHLSTAQLLLLSHVHRVPEAVHASMQLMSMRGIQGEIPMPQCLKGVSIEGAMRVRISVQRKERVQGHSSTPASVSAPSLVEAAAVCYPDYTTPKLLISLGLTCRTGCG